MTKCHSAFEHHCPLLEYWSQFDHFLKVCRFGYWRNSVFYIIIDVLLSKLQNTGKALVFYNTIPSGLGILGLHRVALLVADPTPDKLINDTDSDPIGYGQHDYFGCMDIKTSPTTMQNSPICHSPLYMIISFEKL